MNKIAQIIKKIKKKHFEILYDRIVVDTRGMNICLLDDVTSQYEEPLL